MSLYDLKKMEANAKRTALEEHFLRDIKAIGLPIPEREFQFCEDRKYRADFAYPERNILIEIQGGTWSKSRLGHSTGTGIKRDCEKSNLAQKLGFMVFKFTSDMVKRGEAVRFIEEVLKSSE